MADTKKKIRLKDAVTGEYLYPEVDVNAPTKLSELENDAGFITASAIKDATLTIQKNGSTLGTFTANQSTNKTIDIIVPTTASDVGALADTTKMVSSLELSMDEKTYVITATLKDQDGMAVGKPATIDLPLESVVVDGSYDNTDKKIILTLESGSTVDIPVGDLVSGLQTAITSTNKLSADLIADGTTNKTVTAAEKATWNGKQAAISDIATIRSNASAGKTASDTIATYGDIVTSAKADFAGASHSHSKADITDFPAIPTVSDTYSATSTSAMSGKAVASAISGKMDKVTLAKVATSNSYTDLDNLPTIPAEVTTTTVSGWGYTKNAGTITGIKMNGASKGTSGVVDLGTVITAHQDISGKANTTDLETALTSVCATLDAQTTEWSAT